MTNELLTTRWREVGDKVVELAEAFPTEAYEWRPAAEVRTVGDQLRHVAFWNNYLRDTMRGSSPDGAANELPRVTHADKATVVDALRRSFDEVGAELARGDGADPGAVVSFIEHAGEHYGQLVIYARLCGIIPPASRGG